MLLSLISTNEPSSILHEHTNKPLDSSPQQPVMKIQYRQTGPRTRLTFQVQSREHIQSLERRDVATASVECL